MNMIAPTPWRVKFDFKAGYDALFAGCLILDADGEEVVTVDAGDFIDHEKGIDDDDACSIVKEIANRIVEAVNAR